MGGSKERINDPVVAFSRALRDGISTAPPLEVEFSDLARAVRQPPSWVLRGLLPTGLTFLAGPPKSYKSSLAYAMGAMVAYGARVLPRFAVERPGAVIYLSAEADAGEIRHTLEAGFGVKIPEGTATYWIGEDPFRFRLDDADGAARLMQWLSAHRPRLVVVDTLRDYHGGEERDDGSMNRLLRPVQRWAHRESAAALIVHHTRKPTMGGNVRLSPTDMRGTSALWAIADGAIILTPSRGNVHVEARYKRGEPSSWIWEINKLWKRAPRC